MLRIKVKGLDAFRRDLRAVDKGFPRMLGDAHRRIGDLVARRAEGAAPGRAKGVIRGAGTQRAAKIRVGTRRGDELAVFMGQRRRSGWYAMRRYSGSRGRQFEPWVGNSWDPGEGSEPYFIGPAINQSIDEVLELYGREIDDLAKKAFPN